jgi:3-dehydroquinate synthase
MTKSLIINSSRGKYNVEIGASVLALSSQENCIWLIDQNVSELLPKLRNVIYLTACEEVKSLETCIQILTQMSKMYADKSTRLIAVGGGIVQDIATLTASLYMRGLKWTFVPTTKMAQLDSCIGGKSSINLSGVKNLVGNIFPPSNVLIDFRFDQSLSTQALVAGYLESIKISFARGEEQFNLHLKNAKGYLDLGAIDQQELCVASLSDKKYFIEIDENDKGVRQLLNFGHTFGHALEASSNFGIHHGIAVGLGMLMALEYPLSKKDSRSETLRESIVLLLSHAGRDSFAAIKNISPEDFFRFFCRDKKHSAKHHCLILYTNFGLEKKLVLNDHVHKAAVLNSFNGVRRRLLNELR